MTYHDVSQAEKKNGHDDDTPHFFYATAHSNSHVIVREPLLTPAEYLDYSIATKIMTLLVLPNPTISASAQQHG